MSYCTKCGAPVDGRFCGKCGAPIGVPDAVRPETPVSAPAVPPVNIPASPGVPRKKSPWFWVFAGCFGLIVIAGILVLGTSMFVAYKAKQAGLDPALMEKNPGLAVAKLIAATNPDIEVLSVDDARGIIKVREKKSGKTLTMNLEDAKQGKIVFLDDEGQKLELRAQGEGENASVEVNGPDGAMRMGAGAVRLPEWIAAYPGAETTGQFGLSRDDQSAGSYAFKTRDSIGKVASFYEGALKEQGFEVEQVEMPGQAGVAARVLSAKEQGSARTVQITLGQQDGSTTVSLIFSTKDQ